MTIITISVELDVIAERKKCKNPDTIFYTTFSTKTRAAHAVSATVTVAQLWLISKNPLVTTNKTTNLSY